MPGGRPPKAPIYTLPHGIEVISEYRPNTKCPYWRVRIRPHPFFIGSKVVFGGQCVRRCCVVACSKIGRGLAAGEQVHHLDHDTCNDAPENLLVLTSAEHNAHHKTGSKHRPEVKARIGASVRRAYQEGRHAARPILKRDEKGRIAA